MFTENAAQMLKDHAAASYARQAVKINHRITVYVGYGHSNCTVIEGETSLILVDALDSD